MAEFGKAPANSAPENLSRREFLAKWGILLAAAALPATAIAADGIKDSTRKRVAELQASDPKFKLSDDAKRCLDGIEKDPECDQFINDEVSGYVGKKQVNAREQQVNAREQQVNIAQEALENIEISRAMTQLVLYILLEQIPPKDEDYMNKILTYTTTPADVRDTMREMFQRKKSGKWFTKADGGKILDLAERHLNRAISLGQQLSDPRLKTNVTKMNTNYSQYFQAVRRQIASV